MSVTKEQTAVEWLENKFYRVALSEVPDFFNQAKEMFEQQIEKAYNNGCIDTLKDEMKLGEQYYNETFKTK